MKPRLSIVIPAYNVEGYVVEAIASALVQSLSEIEVIVVDDGSTDRTGEQIAAFDDPRLRVVTQVNGGLSNARNTGIRAARAALIGFLDGDDRWHPDKALRHVELMERDPSIGLSYSHSAYIDEAGRDTGALLLSDAAAPDLVAMIRRNRVGNGSTPVVHADCFRRAGLFDETLRSCEDWEMWVRLLRETGFSARLIPEALTFYRLNTQSLSFNFDGFLRNAEAAAARIAAETPQVDPAHARYGLAMCYRIAAAKAVKIGKTARALALLRRAVTISPSIALTDPRFAATLAVMIAPRRAVSLAKSFVRWRAGLNALGLRRN